MNNVPVLLVLLASLFGAIAHTLHKIGSQNLTVSGAFTNPYIIIGLFFLSGVTVLFLLAYKMGGQVSILYPVYASTYIWSTILATFVLGESFTLNKGIGIATIILGLSILTMTTTSPGQQ